jgi:hypothetical protein
MLPYQANKSPAFLKGRAEQYDRMPSRGAFRDRESCSSSLAREGMNKMSRQAFLTFARHARSQLRHSAGITPASTFTL